MKLLQRNMFGEINWICYLFGHRLCLYGVDEINICIRCELEDERFRRSEIVTKEVKE